MSFNKQQYWEERYKLAKNPRHKNYYAKKIKGFSTRGNNKGVYSELFDKYFGSYTEAAKYIGVSRNYIYRVLVGELKNKHGLREWN